MILEGQVNTGHRIATLFYGLKLNTEHNSALTYSLLNMLRVMLYSVAIVFVSQMHQLALLSVTPISGAVLVFTVLEKPW